MAELGGTSEAKLNTCLQFYRSYDLGELQELETLEVGWSHATITLRIPDKQERHRLLRLAHSEKWTDPEFQRRIQMKLGKRRRGGRPRWKERSQGFTT